MKRVTFIFLALLTITLSFSSVLSEGSDACRRTDAVIASDESVDALLSSLSEGGAVTQTWEGSDGATYVFVLYPETTVIDCGGTVYEQDTGAALTSEELLNIMNWVESQLQAQAADRSLDDDDCFDPAVFQTARPAEEPEDDPAVFQTAMPLPALTADAAVFYTAQPAVVTAAVPAVNRTAQPAPTPSARPASPIVSTGDYTTFDSSMQEQKMLNLLNEDRARHGLPPLTLDPELSRLAQLKSNDMNTNRYFAHESPTYGNAGQMLDAFHYDYRGVGENIAHHANVEKAEAAFMSSDGHRRNILGSQWEKVGIGIAYDENGNVYVTQLFAR